MFRVYPSEDPIGAKGDNPSDAPDLLELWGIRKIWLVCNKKPSLECFTSSGRSTRHHYRRIFVQSTHRRVLKGSTDTRSVVFSQTLFSRSRKVARNIRGPVFGQTTKHRAQKGGETRVCAFFIQTIFRLAKKSPTDIAVYVHDGQVFRRLSVKVARDSRKFVL